MAADRYCYIHIGAPKTGTTALQQFFHEQRLELEKLALRYPDINLRGYGHHDLAFLIHGGYPDWAIPQPKPLQQLVEAFAAQVGSAPGHLLISSENFYLFPNPSKLYQILDQAHVLSRFEPMVIVYLRRQDVAHESWYNQLVKAQGYTGSIDDAVEAFFELWDYQLQLRHWESVFGINHIKIRIYREQWPDRYGVIGDFLQTIDIDKRQFDCPVENPNGRLNKDILTFQGLLNHLPLTPVQKRRYHRELIELSEESRHGSLFDDSPLLSTADRIALLERYSRSNQYVAERYCSRSALFNPIEATACASSLSGHGKGLTPEKIAAIVGWLMLRADR